MRKKKDRVAKEVRQMDKEFEITDDVYESLRMVGSMMNEEEFKPLRDAVEDIDIDVVRHVTFKYDDGVTDPYDVDRKVREELVNLYPALADFRVDILLKFKLMTQSHIRCLKENPDQLVTKSEELLDMVYQRERTWQLCVDLLLLFDLTFHLIETDSNVRITWMRIIGGLRRDIKFVTDGLIFHYETLMQVMEGIGERKTKIVGDGKLFDADLIFKLETLCEHFRMLSANIVLVSREKVKNMYDRLAAIVKEDKEK